MQLEIHPTQAEILMFLLFKPSAHFTELNVTGLETDHLNFHIQRLVKLGLIYKNNEEMYGLTTKGKEFANRFDTHKAQIERQAKVGVLVVAINKSKEQLKFLLQERLKHPYYGYFGFVTGKVRWGETICEAASRELEEETGMKANCTLVGIKHKMDYDDSNTLLEDKFFFVVKADQCTGDLVEQFEGGRNVWLTKDEIFEIDMLFPGVSESLEMATGTDMTFFEKKYHVERY